MEFKVGEYIEVAIGESKHDSDADYIYFLMDREGYTEYEVCEIFDDRGNVIHAKVVSDEFSINLARDNKFSDYFNTDNEDYIKKDKKYVKIELEVELPLDYNEREIDRVIADAIYDLDGQVLDSKEFKEIEPTNI